jgi:glycosyltransferase involved in cell wall biosynthesis
VVNLHWVGGGTLSVRAISKIKKPIVWTLHDMWAFSGAEHYDGGSGRSKTGYKRRSRENGDVGFDLNRFVWGLKRRYWKPFALVAPSSWMMESASKSALMRDWPISVIPNPIDSQSWCPAPKNTSRELLFLPNNCPIVLFGALGSALDSRKGVDLFLSCLDSIKSKLPDAQFVMFGELEARERIPEGHKIIFLGTLRDDLTLRLAYSAADVFVITSRQDNLPNTGIEAQACGTPVVAFNVGGMGDVVEHNHTGYLAEPFNVEDLARGIRFAISQNHEGLLSQAAIERTKSLFSFNRVSQMYREVYAQSIVAQSSE